MQAQRQNLIPYTASQIVGSVFIKVGDALKKINLADIVYMNVSYKNYCDIHTKTRNFAVKTSLSELATNLNCSSFMRIHRNAIINLEYINEVNSKTMTIGTEIGEVDLGRSYKQELIDKLTRI